MWVNVFHLTGNLFFEMCFPEQVNEQVGLRSYSTISKFIFRVHLHRSYLYSRVMK